VKATRYYGTCHFTGHVSDYSCLPQTPLEMLALLSRNKIYGVTYWAKPEDFVTDAGDDVQIHMYITGDSDRTIAFGGLLSGMCAAYEFDRKAWSNAFRLAERLGVAITPAYGYTGSLEEKA
jgi:hypothetical protein